MARGGKKTHQLEDQYGGFDAASSGGNDDHRSGGFNASSSHGFRGGGAGGGKGSNLKYERVVPKFLQKHADLLVGNTIVARKEEEAAELRFGDEEDVGRRGLGSGKNANIINNNNNSTHNGDRDAGESIEERCLELKGKGNRCFQNGEYEQAVDLFTKCIALQRQGKAGSGAEEDNAHIYYSNRSAAYVKLGQFELAKRDALESIERSRGQWAKGWVRLAVVSLALDDLTTHAKAYARAFKLDPLNDDLKEKMDKAQEQERKAMENGLFKFKASSLKASSEGAKKEIGGTKRKNRVDGNSKEKKKSKKKSEVGVLSFNEEEGEEEEEH
jgi:tetratricopeptide (TPR) repeat protein